MIDAGTDLVDLHDGDVVGSVSPGTWDPNFRQEPAAAKCKLGCFLIRDIQTEDERQIEREQPWCNPDCKPKQAENKLRCLKHHCQEWKDGECLKCSDWMLVQKAAVPCCTYNGCTYDNVCGKTITVKDDEVVDEMERRLQEFKKQNADAA